MPLEQAMRPLYELGAAETVALLARGAVSSEAVVRACMDAGCSSLAWAGLS